MHVLPWHVVSGPHGFPTPGGLVHTLLRQENPDAHRSVEGLQTEPPGTRKAQLDVPFSSEILQYAPRSQSPVQGWPTVGRVTQTPHDCDDVPLQLLVVHWASRIHARPGERVPFGISQAAGCSSQLLVCKALPQALKWPAENPLPGSESALEHRTEASAAQPGARTPWHLAR